MHYDSSCFSSTCVTTIQKIVSQNRSAFRRALVQIARCVYVTRTRGKHAHFEHKNDKLSDTNGDSELLQECFRFLSCGLKIFSITCYRLRLNRGIRHTG